MDTKLILKISFTVLNFTILFTSCKSSHKLSNLDRYYGLEIAAAERMKNETESEYWIRNYKIDVFYNCFYHGFKNDSIMKQMGKEDLAVISDVVTFSFWPKIRENGKNALRYMKKNEYISDDPKDKELNFISITCLNYLMSRELDSIAKNEYKSHLKLVKENEKMWNKQ